MKTKNAKFVRASISFPAEIYETLEDIAKQKKVSLAWVVRDAAEKYIALMNSPGGEAGRTPRKLARRAT
jgi:predicted DNA-binding protein